MLADVAQAGRAEQRVDDRVQQHVGVRMAEQAQTVRDRDPADDQFAAFDEGVAVVAGADAERRGGIVGCQSHGFFHTQLVEQAARYISAMRMSAGSVTFKFRGWPSTSFGARPKASTALASSVMAAASVAAASASRSNR